MIFLSTIVSGAFSEVAEMRRAVKNTLVAVEAIEEHQSIRGLVWPICIAACLASVSLRNRFKTVI
jgi:C6 transcription factor Pro1